MCIPDTSTSPGAFRGKGEFATDAARATVFVTADVAVDTIRISFATCASTFTPGEGRRCGLLRRLSVGTDLCCCGSCLYYHSSCNLRFVSSCQVSSVGTMWTAEKAR